jgi:hypothetical protein
MHEKEKREREHMVAKDWGKDELSSLKIGCE